MVGSIVAHEEEKWPSQAGKSWAKIYKPTIFHVQKKNIEDKWECGFFRWGTRNASQLHSFWVREMKNTLMLEIWSRTNARIVVVTATWPADCCQHLSRGASGRQAVLVYLDQARAPPVIVYRTASGNSCCQSVKNARGNCMMLRPSCSLTYAL